MHVVWYVPESEVVTPGEKKFPGKLVPPVQLKMCFIAYLHCYACQRVETHTKTHPLTTLFLPIGRLFMPCGVKGV